MVATHWPGPSGRPSFRPGAAGEARARSAVATTDLAFLAADQFSVPIIDATGVARAGDRVAVFSGSILLT